MIGVQPLFAPDDPAAIALADGVLQAVAPLIERTRVASAAEIGVETFGQRLRGELQRNLAVLAPGILLSAWATTRPEYHRDPVTAQLASLARVIVRATSPPCQWSAIVGPARFSGCGDQ